MYSARLKEDYCNGAETEGAKQVLPRGCNNITAVLNRSYRGAERNYGLADVVRQVC